MSDILTKSTLPGTIGSPGFPSRPGIPAQPGYYLDVPVQVPIYKVVGTQAPYVTITIIGYKWVTQQVWFPPVPAKPAVPGYPPVSGTPADFQRGWNAGASSIISQTGNIMYQFTVPAGVVGVVTGIGSPINDGSYQNIQWGIYASGTQYQVIENGATKTSAATFASADVFTITRVNGQVQYYKGSTLIYTSTAPINGTTYASSALYFGGDPVNNAAWVTLTSAFSNVIGTCAGTLRKLTSYISQSAANIVYPGTLKKLTGTSTGVAPNTCAAPLKKLAGQAFAFQGATFLNGTLKKVTGYGESSTILAPQFAMVQAQLQNVSGFSAAVGSSTTSCAGVLKKVVGFSYNSSFGAGGNGFVYPPAQLSKLYGFSSTTARAYGVLRTSQPYSLFAQAHQDTSVSLGFHGKLSGYGFAAQTGAQARVTLSGFAGKVTASATSTALAEAYLVGPHYQLLATGTGTQLGRAYLKLTSHYTVTGLAGANAALAGPRPYALTGHAYTGVNARAYLALSGFSGSVNASATQRAFGLVAGTLGKLQAARSGVLAARGPRLTLVATGHNLDVAPVYEAYSIALIPNENNAIVTATTRYNNYPFDRIVRFGGTYYGVAADGLYALDGDTFNGAPIVATVATAESDMGDRHQKRPISLYLSGRMGADLMVSVSSAEVRTDTYMYPAVKTGGDRNQRVRFGKGIKARYLSYGFTNVAGEYFELDEFTPEIEILRRTA